MFFEMVIKEIKYQFRSITFYGFLLVMLLFYISQYVGDQGLRLEPPKPGMDDYGYTDDVSETDRLTYVHDLLGIIIVEGSVGRYAPFHKETSLSDEQLEAVQAFYDAMMVEGQYVTDSETAFEFADKLDEDLGGNTAIGPKYRNVSREMTYEEAAIFYETLGQEDRFTDAFGRLLADYMGIVVILFVPFVTAFIMAREKRARVEDVIYATNLKPVAYVFSRYLGVVIVLAGGVMSLALIETIWLAVEQVRYDVAINYTGIFYFTVVWVVPTIMIVTAMSFGLCVLLKNAVVTVVIQFIFGFMMLMTVGLSGDYRLWYLNIRFNELGNRALYLECQGAILGNRLLMVVLSLVIVWLASLVYKAQRDHVMSLVFGGKENEHNHSQSA